MGIEGIFKDHAERTQGQPDKFAEQCAIPEYEAMLSNML
jgi:hypothetical protein